MRQETKSVRAEFKAVDGAPDGTFEAIVAVFGNVDLGGDRIVKGAFARSLKEWEDSGDPIPVLWSHDWDDPLSHIGYVETASETDEGLHVRALLDVKNNQRAEYVARLLKGRRVREFSFGYFPVKSQEVEEAGRDWPIRELLDLDVFEVGPTLLGMNPDTRLIRAASLTGNGTLDPDVLAAIGKAVAEAVHESTAATLEADTTETTEPDGSRDSAPTMNHEQVADLLARTRYTEE